MTSLLWYLAGSLCFVIGTVLQILKLLGVR
jgi:hypothetical protein